MVVSNHFQDIYDMLPEIPPLSLPVAKDNILKIVYERVDEVKTIYNGLQPPLPFANSDVFHASIFDWKRLTAADDGCKAVYEIKFDVTGSNFNFKAGDTIGIITHNNELDVNFLINHLDLSSQADLCYNLSIHNNQKGKIPAHIPQKSSLRHVLTNCVDLRSVIKKLFLLALSKYTTDKNERKVLEYLCSKEGSAAYSTHILNKNLFINNLFTIFKSCKPPVEVLLANLPRLLPRPYSIVNSGLKNSNIVKICFSVMYLDDKRKGLTTGWLEDIILNKEFNIENEFENLSISNEILKSGHHKVPIYIRKNISGFSLPEKGSPLILLSPGTGVSPFIGFLEEIELLKEKKPNVKFNDVWLYFGCRNPKLDFIYEKELTDFKSKGILSKLSTAFSRVANQDIKYIQDALHRDGEDITKLIKDGATIFVCGDLKTMALQVKDTLVRSLMKYDNKSEEEAHMFISNMQKEKKYVVDMWS